MRKETTLDLGQGRVLEIRELTVRDVWELDYKGLTWLEPLLKASTGLTMGDIQDLTPSEIRELWAKVKEVNTDFFGLAQDLGLEMEARMVREMVVTSYRALFAGLLAPATASESGTMAGASS